MALKDFPEILKINLENKFESRELICYSLFQSVFFQARECEGSKIMITEIGIAAGDIWHYLDERGSATLDQLTQGIRKPRELLLMSLGWLAREGHITLGGPETGYAACLTRR